MRVRKNDPEFKAKLTDMKRYLLAEGVASVSQEDQSVDFQSDFVPLFPLGERLKIIRTFDDREIHLFCGEVYISDKNLLRIVNVFDFLLPGSEDIYRTPTAIAAQFIDLTEPASPLVEEPRKFSLFHRKKKAAAPAPSWHSVMVSAISSTGLEFSSTHMMEQGASLRLTLELPDSEGGALTDLPVRISQVYAFGDDVAYLGEFESMDKGLKARLDELAKRLNQKENRFFPDVQVDDGAIQKHIP